MAEKILVVDDDMDTLRLAGLMLERQGYTIIAAASGKQAIALANTERPALILLDVMMPDIDGVQVAKQLRTTSETKHIPIIMFTAKNQLEDKLLGFEAGADAYLTKPTQPRELVAQVKAVLARARLAPSSPPIARQKGALIGVLAVKGGVGVSTIALNLALVLQRAKKKEVVLADFRPGSGTLGLELGYSDSKEMTPLLETQAPSLNIDMVESQLREASFDDFAKIRLLLSSSHPKDAKYAGAADIFAALANNLAFLGGYVVLDLGSSFTSMVESVLQQCQIILLVLEPVPATVKQTRSLMEFLTAENSIPANRMLVALVNRVRTGMQLSLSQVQDVLGRQVSVIFTPASEQTYQASYEHIPLVVKQPDSLSAQQFMTLAEKVVQTLGS